MNKVHFLKSLSRAKICGYDALFSDFVFFNPPTKIGPNFACTPYVIQISLPIFHMLSLASVLLER